MLGKNKGDQASTSRAHLCCEITHQEWNQIRVYAFKAGESFINDFIVDLIKPYLNNIMTDSEMSSITKICNSRLVMFNDQWARGKYLS